MPNMSADGALMARILVVEDDVDSANALGEFLGFLGYDVNIAFNGTDALALFVSAPPSLVISDINMPLLDGLGVARALRSLAAGAATPLVALTALSQPADIAASMEAGFNAHLSKPADLDQLEKLLKALIN